MKLGIIGCGAIGTDVGKAANEINEVEKIYLYDINKKSSEKLNRMLDKSEIKDVKEPWNIDNMIQSDSYHPSEQERISMTYACAKLYLKFHNQLARGEF